MPSIEFQVPQQSLRGKSHAFPMGPFSMQSPIEKHKCPKSTSKTVEMSTFVNFRETFRPNRRNEDQDHEDRSGSLVCTKVVKWYY